MGYKFQFITLAGFHALNYSMFDLARGYKASQMTAYVALQQAEFAAEKARLYRHAPSARSRRRLLRRCDADHHQRAAHRLTALSGSTEEQQFHTA